MGVGLQKCKYSIDDWKLKILVINKTFINSVSRSQSDDRDRTRRSSITKLWLWYLLSPSVKLWNVFWFMWNDKTDFSSINTIISKCNGVFWISGSLNDDKNCLSVDWPSAVLLAFFRLNTASLSPLAFTYIYNKKK